MTRIAKAAMISAVLTSVMSVADAARHGLTGQFLLDEDAAARAVMIGSNALIAVTFALLAAVLIEHARGIDAGRRPIRGIRRLMQSVLVVLAIVFAGGLAVDVAVADTTAVYRIVEAVGGGAFVLMFVVGIVLGACLLRRPRLRPAATLMVAPAVIIPVTLLVSALAPAWAHPAYAESALYIGLALLGRGTSDGHRHDARPAEPADLDAVAP